MALMAFVAALNSSLVSCTVTLLLWRLNIDYSHLLFDCFVLSYLIGAFHFFQSGTDEFISRGFCSFVSSWLVFWWIHWIVVGITECTVDMHKNIHNKSTGLNEVGDAQHFLSFYIQWGCDLLSKNKNIRLTVLLWPNSVFLSFNFETL